MATGVKVQRLEEDDSVVNITPIIKPEEDSEVQAAADIIDKSDGSEQLALVNSAAIEEPEFDEEPFEELE